MGNRLTLHPYPDSGVLVDKDGNTLAHLRPFDLGAATLPRGNTLLGSFDIGALASREIVWMEFSAYVDVQ